MLAMLGLVLSVCVVLLLLFLLLLLPSLGSSLTVVGLFVVYFLLALVFFMHLVVLYWYQGADVDAEQLALTEQLFDAALGELCVVARGQPCLLVGDFNVEPTKIPCLAKGISAGLWVDLEGAWALAAGLQPSPTCKRDWDSLGGRRRDFMVGCPFVWLLFIPAGFRLIGGLLLILLLGLFLTFVGGVAV